MNSQDPQEDIPQIPQIITQDSIHQDPQIITQDSIHQDPQIVIQEDIPQIPQIVTQDSIHQIDQPVILEVTDISSSVVQVIEPGPQHPQDIISSTSLVNQQEVQIIDDGLDQTNPQPYERQMQMMNEQIMNANERGLINLQTYESLNIDDEDIDVEAFLGLPPVANSEELENKSNKTSLLELIDGVRDIIRQMSV